MTRDCHRFMHHYKTLWYLAFISLLVMEIIFMFELIISHCYAFSMSTQRPLFWWLNSEPSVWHTVYYRCNEWAGLFRCHFPDLCCVCIAALFILPQIFRVFIPQLKCVQEALKQSFHFMVIRLMEREDIGLRVLLCWDLLRDYLLINNVLPSCTLCFSSFSFQTYYNECLNEPAVHNSFLECITNTVLFSYCLL